MYIIFMLVKGCHAEDVLNKSISPDNSDFVGYSVSGIVERIGSLVQVIILLFINLYSF